MKNQTIVLIVLDGWGIGKKDMSNPINTVNPQNINYLKANFPSGALQASGIAVGLPWGEEGNSEVGHMNMGAGRIIYQNYPRITLSIRDGSFFKNEVLKKAFDHAKENNSSANFIGLLTEANVHASLEHLEALVKFAQNENFPKEKVNFHLITDGRDSPPQSALNLIKRLPHPEQLASVSGRYYAMDRDNHWERTKEAYNAITGQGLMTDDYETHIRKTYQKNLNDEYVLPILIEPSRPVKDNDAVVFFNFREDRMKQIVKSFIEKDFNKFPVKNFSNLFIAAMIQYDATFDIPAVYPPDKIENCLSKVLTDNKKTQWRIAETEKYAHITYFFNGQKEAPFENEYRVLVPSKVEFHYDEHPEMMSSEITARLTEAIEEKAYDFILANYANSDIIAHTGNFNAAVEAVKTIDEQIGKITKAVLNNDAILIITSDHGNIERMFNPQTGEPETKHDPNPVPIYLIANKFKRQRTEQEIISSEKAPIGVLADISPTILELMGIPKPKEMTAQSLLGLLL